MIMPWEGGKAALTFQRNLQRRKQNTESQLASITLHPRSASTLGPPQDTARLPAVLLSPASPSHCIIHLLFPKTGALKLQLCQSVSLRQAGSAPMPGSGMLLWHKWSLPGGCRGAERDGNHVPSTDRGCAKAAALLLPNT